MSLTGNALVAFHDFYGECTSLEAEIRALNTGLRKTRGPWTVQYHLEEIQRWLSKLEVSFSHIWREGNIVADWLASNGYKEKHFKLLKARELTGEVRGLLRLDNWGLPNFRV
ncbi:Ribonuclease H protein [Abeliophyllum distichum]|uniref:Ribonuclease H protein n=1 Tax=Abeliophyllum distichum TaxID=126358 RepID=A0ABD1TH25_9LAMI